MSARSAERFAGESMCERCGNVFRGKRWVAGTAGEIQWPVGLRWTVCPACRLIAAQRGYGRILVRGARALDAVEAIRARVSNVAERAGYTQPQRRIIAIEKRGEELEILATSQKLAHRLVSALLAAFGGDARFTWSAEDGALHARWTWDRPAGENLRAPAVITSARPAEAPRPGIMMRCRGVVEDPAWRDRIESRAERWGKRHPGLRGLDVTIEHGVHHRHGSEVVKASALFTGGPVHAKKRAPTIEVALREALDSLERELTAARERREVERVRPPSSRAVARG